MLFAFRLKTASRTLLRNSVPRDEEAGPGSRTAAGTPEYCESTRNATALPGFNVPWIRFTSSTDVTLLCTVDGQDDIALDDTDIIGERAGLHTGLPSARSFAQGPHGIALRLIEFADVDTGACLLRFRADLFIMRAAQGVILALLQNLRAVADGQLEIELLAAAWRTAVMSAGEPTGRSATRISWASPSLIDLPFGRGDVLRFQPRFLRRSVRSTSEIQNAVVGAESAEQVRLVVLYSSCISIASVASPRPDHVVVHLHGHVHRQGDPMPWYPPLWVAIIVLTPITSPRIFSSGPPLFPG